MIFTRFLPGVLKEIMKHIPTVLFDTVEWGVLAHEFPKVSKRYLQKEGFAELFAHQKSFLDPYDILLKSSIDKRSPLSSQVGNSVLKLYFLQIHSPYGIFLDHSENHFDLIEQKFVFSPNPLWTKFDPLFQTGLIKIYDGYYFEDNQMFLQGLYECKLMNPSWDEHKKQQMMDLFKDNFGISKDENMSFRLDQFKDSFMKIADFLLENKVKIGPDFIYLGISLITMYSCLEKLNTEANVQKIYTETKKALKQNESL